jgi:hypothetical protein
MGKDKPRWEPSSGMTADSVTIFLGYANDLDVWSLDGTDRIVVVGPESRLIHPNSRCNFDALDIVDGNLVDKIIPNDLHIDVHDMCLIYALCVEHGLFKENTNEPK